MTRSAPAAAAALFSTTSSARLSSSTRARVAAERAVATIERTAPCARAARAIEEPMRPTPIRARRSKSGVSFFTGLSAGAANFPRKGQGEQGRGEATSTASGRAPQEFLQRGDDEAVGLFAADAHAQGIGELVDADLAQNESARGEEGVCLLSGVPVVLRKVDQQKVGDARRHFEAELSDFLREPCEPACVVLARALQVLQILDRGGAGGDRRRVDVERAANTVDRGNDMGRSEHRS